MSVSWTKFASKCKSRLSAIARGCFLGRASWRERCLEFKQLLEEAQVHRAEAEAGWEQSQHENELLRARIAELEAECARPRPIKLPIGEPPAYGQYGVGLISLCVNLSAIVGPRPTVRVVEAVFDWLGVKERLPEYQSITLWSQRIGLDRMEQARKFDGGVWLADHTNQIGKEKALSVVRVRPNCQSTSGPLQLQDLEVLTILPAINWKRDDVAAVYRALVKQYGIPRAIVCDGAVELREPVEMLGKPGKRPLVLRDPKHYFANQYEALLTKDPEYQAFTTKLAGTRSALQQTELAHFIPPSAKMKSRFMNMAPTLHWAEMVLCHLEHPESQSRRGIADARMTEKLGWLCDFASKIREWQACQDVISHGLTFLNEHGITPKASKLFQEHVQPYVRGAMSRKFLQKATEFLREHEHQLRPGERLPMSTEILESSFARYKQLEKQHSKNGFTSLLLAYPTLFRPTTSKEVKASFARVKVADVIAWMICL